MFVRVSDVKSLLPKLIFAAVHGLATVHPVNPLSLILKVNPVPQMIHESEKVPESMFPERFSVDNDPAAILAGDVNEVRSLFAALIELLPAVLTVAADKLRPVNELLSTLSKPIACDPYVKLVSELLVAITTGFVLNGIELTSKLVKEFD